jgi:hypothetical protein
MASDTFGFGKYIGKTLEQVALADYQYLAWAKDNANVMPKKQKERAEEIIYKLDNFIPAVKCVNCGETADKISTTSEKNYDATRDYSVKGSSFYCSKEPCVGSIPVGVRANIKPIKFSTILEYPAFPRYIRKDMQKILLKTAGFNGKVTEKAAEEFINSIRLEGYLF